MVKNFETVSLSHQTIQRRVVDMGNQVEKKTVDLIQKCAYFSLYLDESTDQTDVSQLLIFVRYTQEDFLTREELLDIRPLHGTTKRKDVYSALKKSIEKNGGLEKCSAIITDGAPAMVGDKSGLVGLLRQDGMTCPAIHCIIHQSALRGKSIKQSEVLKLIVKSINIMRGGNKALIHRKLKEFLDEMDAEYGYLVLYNQVRWLSAGSCLERFFSMRKELLVFLREVVPSDTSEIEEKLESIDFLKEFAFLTDLTNHLNELNLKLQGKQKLVSDLMSHVNGFRNKSKIFQSTIEKNELTHFKNCAKIVDDFPDEETDFSIFKANIGEISNEFERRFADFDKLKPSIALFTNPMTVEIEQQDPKFQMELCDLQADSFLQSVKQGGPDFFKLLDNERFPNLRDLGLLLTSMFGSSYICAESTFSSMKHIKNTLRNRLTDSSLSHLLRLSNIEIDVDIDALVSAAEAPQTSH